METKQLAQYYKILADHTRLKIIAMLKSGSMCACQMLEQLHITQPTLSYHMNMMSKHNLVTSKKEGVWVHYTLNLSMLNELTEFLKVSDNCCSKKKCACKKHD